MKSLLLLFMLVSSVVFGHTTGLRAPGNWKLGAPFQIPFSAAPLPDHFDWREKSPIVPAVKNQGSCGSCWAFSITSAVEWAVAVHEGKEVVLAPQELVSCDKKQWGCSGGFFNALDFLITPGETYEKDFPYVGKNVRCKANLPHDYHLQEWHYVGESSRKPLVDEIRNAIYTSGPVPVDVFANGRFQSYKSGVFSAPGAGSTNHMVTLIGWDMPGKYWIMQNSWGANWGEKGYMRIKFGSSGIANVAANVVYRP
jgi:C1A family cysteine protease